MQKRPIESEKLLDRKLGSEVKKRKGLYIKVEPIHIIGIPDRFIFLPQGIVYIVELKTTNQKPSRLQYAVHKMFEKIGFPVWIIDDSEGIKTLLKEYDER